jgi:predicted RNA-binding Zn ribbon-like protein
MLVMNGAPTGTDHAAEHVFELSGGRLCLDFVNTVSGDRSAAARERMPTYAGLLSFARQAKAIEPADERRLLAEARRRPEEAAEVHARALALREALYRIFTAVAEGGEPAEPDLQLLSEHLARALSHRRIARTGKACCALAWSDPPGALDAPLWRVAASAAELLTSEVDLRRVRVCGMHATHECSWVFMDHTRAGTRRWCSMKDCGNKAKARRHYERSRGG